MSVGHLECFGDFSDMSALYIIATALRYFAVSKLYRKRAGHFAVSVGFVMTVGSAPSTAGSSKTPLCLGI